MREESFDTRRQTATGDKHEARTRERTISSSKTRVTIIDENA